MTCVGSSGAFRDENRSVLGRGSCEAQRPVARTVEDIARAADEPDARYQRSLLTEALSNELFARDRGRAVTFHALHHVAVEPRNQFARLVLSGEAVVGVDVPGRNEDKEPGRFGKRGHRTPDLAGMARHADHDVPALFCDSPVEIQNSSATRAASGLPRIQWRLRPDH
jgi:hypothetical protein